MRKLGYLLKNIGLKNKIWWLIRIGHYLSSDKKNNTKHYNYDIMNKRRWK